MSVSPRLRQGGYLALIAGGLIVLAWGWGLPPARSGVPAGPVVATALAGGVGGAAPDEQPGPAPQVYVRSAITPRAAAVWAKLGIPVPMTFAEDVPLSEVLKLVKASTQGPDMESGIPIYVDPQGLIEAEKTLDSTIQINLEGIPLAKSLKLALGQLGLFYRVDDDGVLIINSETSLDDGPDESTMILNELTQLRKEVAELRILLGGARHRAGAAAPAAGGSGGGGFQ